MMSVYTKYVIVFFIYDSFNFFSLPNFSPNFADHKQKVDRADETNLNGDLNYAPSSKV
jgi:hypothetical protein